MENLKSSNFVTIPLTTLVRGKERVPYRSGLNWGQRPKRDENQAYLSIPAEVQRNGFFPAKGEEFSVFCDDGTEMICVRAQQNGKALHSKPNNSILGLYFRGRLELEPGELVIVQHLLRYGRTSLDFHKRDGAPYFLDFSPKNPL